MTEHDSTAYEVTEEDPALTHIPDCIQAIRSLLVGLERADLRNDSLGREVYAKAIKKFCDKILAKP